jgi:hypothetical protein
VALFCGTLWQWPLPCFVVVCPSPWRHIVGFLSLLPAVFLLVTIDDFFVSQRGSLQVTFSTAFFEASVNLAGPR